MKKVDLRKLHRVFQKHGILPFTNTFDNRYDGTRAGDIFGSGEGYRSVSKIGHQVAAGRGRGSYDSGGGGYDAVQEVATGGSAIGDGNVFGSGEGHRSVSKIGHKVAVGRGRGSYDSGGSGYDAVQEVATGGAATGNSNVFGSGEGHRSVSKLGHQRGRGSYDFGGSGYDAVQEVATGGAATGDEVGGLLKYLLGDDEESIKADEKFRKEQRRRIADFVEEELEYKLGGMLNKDQQKFHEDYAKRIGIDIDSLSFSRQFQYIVQRAREFEAHRKKKYVDRRDKFVELEASKRKQWNKEHFGIDSNDVICKSLILRDIKRLTEDDTFGRTLKPVTGMVLRKELHEDSHFEKKAASQSESFEDPFGDSPFKVDTSLTPQTSHLLRQSLELSEREANKKVLKDPGIEQKVVDATSNEPWGPPEYMLADIAQATRNPHEYQMLMSVVWKRVNYTGKNWWHVYMALTILEYLVAHGSERVIDEIKEHSYQISTLSDFQYIDPSGRDQGNNVRKKSQNLIILVNDKERIVEVRQKAAVNREKFNLDGDRFNLDGDRYVGYYVECVERYVRNGYKIDDRGRRSRSVDYNYDTRSRSSGQPGMPGFSSSTGYSMQPPFASLVGQSTAQTSAHTYGESYSLDTSLTPQTSDLSLQPLDPRKVVKVLCIEQKVLDATSNDPWGPHGTLLADIAQATRNPHEYQIIMSVVWKRINETGENWRHVNKALTVLEYLVAHGSERVIDEIKEHSCQILTLSDFQYIDPCGLDLGSIVRKKSQNLVILVNDKERIVEVRQKAAVNREKFRNNTPGGMYRPGSHSSIRSYGDRYEEDRYASRGEDRNGYGYGREREMGSRDTRSRNSDRDRDFDDDGQHSSRKREVNKKVLRVPGIEQKVAQPPISLSPPSSTIQHILEIGGGSWDRDTVIRALLAANNNPKRAVGYLHSLSICTDMVRIICLKYPGIPNLGGNENTGVYAPLQIGHQGISNMLGNVDDGCLGFLWNSQQFQSLKIIFQDRPQIIEDLRNENPEAMQFIDAIQAKFLPSSK